jgi:hypothetical protein
LYMPQSRMPPLYMPQSLMPPRQPIMLKRTSYYASQIKNTRKHLKKGINGSQMGLLNYLISGK